MWEAWRRFTSQLVKCLVICGFCERGCFGGTPTGELRWVHGSGGPETATLSGVERIRCKVCGDIQKASRAASRLCSTDGEHNKDEQKGRRAEIARSSGALCRQDGVTIWEFWNVCPACKSRPHRNTRQAYVVPMHWKYMRMLLSPANPMELHVLPPQSDLRVPCSRPCSARLSSRRIPLAGPVHAACEAHTHIHSPPQPGRPHHTCPQTHRQGPGVPAQPLTRMTPGAPRSATASMAGSMSAWQKTTRPGQPRTCARLPAPCPCSRTSSCTATMPSAALCCMFCPRMPGQKC